MPTKTLSLASKIRTYPTRTTIKNVRLKIKNNLTPPSKGKKNFMPLPTKTAITNTITQGIKTLVNHAAISALTSFLAHQTLNKEALVLL